MRIFFLLLERRLKFLERVTNENSNVRGVAALAESGSSTSISENAISRMMENPEAHRAVRSHSMKTKMPSNFRDAKQPIRGRFLHDS